MYDERLGHTYLIVCHTTISVHLLKSLTEVSIQKSIIFLLYYKIVLSGYVKNQAFQSFLMKQILYIVQYLYNTFSADYMLVYTMLKGYD